MHGQTIGALRVYRFTPDTPKASKVTAMNLQKLWELTGSQGDKWHKAQVMIPKLVRAHKVSLRIRSDFAAVYFVFRISYFVCHQHFLFSLFLQIFIEAVVGSSYTGDIAIDDITFTTGPCSSKKKQH